MTGDSLGERGFKPDARRIMEAKPLVMNLEPKLT
jgi:hypothetical protein